MKYTFSGLNFANYYAGYYIHNFSILAAAFDTIDIVI